jgi:hypothetical protein
MLVVEGEVAALPAPHTRHLRTTRRFNVVFLMEWWRRRWNDEGKITSAGEKDKKNL